MFPFKRVTLLFQDFQGAHETNALAQPHVLKRSTRASHGSLAPPDTRRRPPQGRWSGLQCHPG